MYNYTFNIMNSIDKSVHSTRGLATKLTQHESNINMHGSNCYMYKIQHGRH